MLEPAEAAGISDMEAGADERGTNLIREQNLKTVRRLMNRRIRATKAELSRESGLSVVAFNLCCRPWRSGEAVRREECFSGPRASRRGLPL